MSNLEPTYLRYIYDGLVNGTIHAENAAELPEGLIGMYEEAFDERTSVLERQKLLQRFAIWALLKKEVSAAFVAEVLEESEDDIQQFISTYSAWFNSPVSGKYQLYHERLKVYLLQKLSEGEIHALHEKLISRLVHFMEEQKADEFEYYGLEFLAGHLSVRAMLSGDGNQLIKLAYSQAHKQRQLKISKGYTWTKNGLKEVMSFASKHNEDEVIECGLQMVDLHHKEQNAAPQIVALVAEGDFDSALERIEQFGGNDKEGLKRKFLIYMLCLMELTLVKKRNKFNNSEGIEKLFIHLEKNIQVNDSLNNWKSFFPEGIIQSLLDISAKMGVGDLSNTQKINLNIKINKQSFNSYSRKLNYDIALDSFTNPNIEYVKVNVKKNDEENAKFYFENGLFFLQEGNKINALDSFRLAVHFSNLIPEDDMWGSYGDCLKMEFVKKLLELNFHHLAIQMYLSMQKKVGWDVEALESICKTLLESDDGKNIKFLFKSEKKNDMSFKTYINYLHRHGKYNDLKNLIYYHLEQEKFSIDGHKQLIFFNKLISHFPNFNFIYVLTQAEFNSRNYSGQLFTDKLIANFCSKELVNEIKPHLLQLINLIKEDYTKADIVKKQAKLIFELEGGPEFILKNGVWSEDFNQESYFRDVFNDIFHLSTLDTILEMVSKIENEFNKFSACEGILNAYNCPLSNSNHQKENLEYIITIVCSFFKTEKYKSLVIHHLCKLLNKNLDFEKSLEFVNRISDDSLKAKILFDISSYYIQKRNFEEAEKFLKVSMLTISSLIDEKDKNRLFYVKSGELAVLGEIQKALDYANCITDNTLKNEAQMEIFFKNNQLEESLKYVREMSDEDRVRALLKISKEFNKQGNKKEAFTVMEEALIVAGEVSEVWKKNILLISIAEEMVDQANYGKALIIANELDTIGELNVLILIFDELIQKGEQEDAKKLLYNSIEILNGLEENYKNNLLCNIAADLAKKGKLEEAKEVINSAIRFTNEKDKTVTRSTALINICTFLINKGMIPEVVKICEEIPLGNKRDFALENLVSACLKKYGVKETISIINIIKSDNLKVQFQQKIAEILPVLFMTKDIYRQFCYYLISDMDSLEKVIYYFALNQFFFEKLPEQKILRFNQTLNLQWAVDIKSMNN